MEGSFISIFGLILSIFNVFATQQRFLSSLQLRVIKELFHQSSFYLKNIASSFQLLFKKSYLHFSPGGKVRGMSGEMSWTPKKVGLLSLEILSFGLNNFVNLSTKFFIKRF